MRTTGEARNSWWLNPPDDRDIPQCERCGEIVNEEDLDDDWVCLDCRKRWSRPCVWYGNPEDMPAAMRAHNESLEDE